jgi:hypothetical protein
MAVALTRQAVSGEPAPVEIYQLVLYDASVIVVGLMLFPVVWNP